MTPYMLLKDCPIRNVFMDVSKVELVSLSSPETSWTDQYSGLEEKAQ